MNRIGAVIAEALEAAGVTQTDLANHLNASQATVSRWISGTNWPHRDKWPIIETYLGMPPRSIARAAGFDDAGSVEDRLAALERQIAEMKRLLIGRLS